jgi:hypothetical protein
MNSLQKQVSNWAGYLALPRVMGMVYIMVEYRLFWSPAVMALIPVIPSGKAYRPAKRNAATVRKAATGKPLPPLVPNASGNDPDRLS